MFKDSLFNKIEKKTNINKETIMNLANKITVSRMFITLVILAILLFPFESAGVDFTNLFINELIVVNTKYIIVGILFVIAIITDRLDGYVARKKNIKTELGKTLDDIADKLLIDLLLIVLASQGFVHPVIPTIIIARDFIVNAIKMTAVEKGIELKHVKITKEYSIKDWYYINIVL